MTDFWEGIICAALLVPVMGFFAYNFWQGNKKDQRGIKQMDDVRGTACIFSAVTSLGLFGGVVANLPSGLEKMATPPQVLTHTETQDINRAVVRLQGLINKALEDVEPNFPVVEPDIKDEQSVTER